MTAAKAYSPFPEYWNVPSALLMEQPVKLPPMEELAESLGVSRDKLREELIAVEAYGVVDMRPAMALTSAPLTLHRHVHATTSDASAIYFDRDARDILSQPFTKLIPLSSRPCGRLYAY